MSRDSSRLPNTLTPKQLLVGLVLLTLIPFAFVVTLYWSLPVTPDPVLQVEVQIAPRAWQSNDGTQSRLLPSAIIRNTTSAKWKNVNFAINDQFFYYHPDPIDPAGELVVPLKFFHTKGNQFFPPESQSIQTFTVYAQIPSGARAIKELRSSELLGSDEPLISN
jgi:hypothetical protein